MKTVIYLALLLTLTGCSIFKSNPETTNFDLDKSGLADSPNLGITIPQRLSSTLPSSTKMIFYFPGNEVKYDLYNNWAQTPQDLLGRYFTIYFNNPEKKSELSYDSNYTLNGTIYEFECDTNTKEAIFAIGITIKDKNDDVLLTKLYGSKVKMEKLSASDFAEAMSKAVNNVTSQIYKDIINLKNNSKL